MSNVYKKLMDARIQLQNTKLNKSGHNKFAGYKYFELGDFLPSINTIFWNLGLCGTVSFTADLATLTITDIDDASQIIITSPMGSAALKGCHEVQNIGACETYQRRYLWVTALEVIEHDILDAVTGTDTGTPAKKPELELKQPEFSKQEMEIFGEKAAQITEYISAKKFADAMAIYDELDNEQKTALWFMLDSTTRRLIKEYKKGN
jgi:hypothetical protein